MRSPFGSDLSLWAVSLVFGLCVSCQSLPDGYAPLDSGNRLKSFLDQIERSCALSRGTGSFAATLQASSVPAMRFEGAWSQGFSLLRAEVQSPLGESVVSFVLSGGEEGARLQMEGSPPADFGPLEAFLEILGPSTLRRIACGQHLEGEGFSRAQAVVFSGDFPHNFLTRSKIAASGGSFNGRSEIFVRARDGATLVSAKTTYSTGLFFQRDVATVFWEGETKAGLVSPSRLAAFLPGGEITLTFSDFD